MKTNQIILTILIGLASFNSFGQVDEQTKFKMFCSAFDNRSTAPNYLVVTVKNLNTNEKKEICTEAPFLNGAVFKETGVFQIPLNCNEYKVRYFEFKEDSALWNISFDLYTSAELDSFAKTINASEITNQVKSGKLTSKIFKGDRKEQRMFGHLMFNNGVMMTRGCIAGNICGLTYYKEE